MAGKQEDTSRVTAQTDHVRQKCPPTEKQETLKGAGHINSCQLLIG